MSQNDYDFYACCEELKFLKECCRTKKGNTASIMDNIPCALHALPALLWCAVTKQSCEMVAQTSASTAEFRATPRRHIHRLFIRHGRPSATITLRHTTPMKTALKSGANAWACPAALPEPS